MTWFENVTWLETILITIVVVLIILPPKWDPAIRLREWLNDEEDKRNGK